MTTETVEKPTGQTRGRLRTKDGVARLIASEAHAITALEDIGYPEHTSKVLARVLWELRQDGKTEARKVFQTFRLIVGLKTVK